MIKEQPGKLSKVKAEDGKFTKDPETRTNLEKRRMPCVRERPVRVGVVPKSLVDIHP